MELWLGVCLAINLDYVTVLFSCSCDKYNDKLMRYNDVKVPNMNIIRFLTLITYLNLRVVCSYEL